MAGYVIHLAVAEEYLRKNPSKKEDYNDFIEGVIYPDSVKDKSETHYGIKSCEANLYDFLKENEIDNSFRRGYFLHLLTDYLFYNKYVDTMSKDMYNDYDILNKSLMEKYKVVLPEKIEGSIFYKNGELKILSRQLVEGMIEAIANMDIDEVAEEVKKDPEKWTKIRKLKRI